MHKAVLAAVAATALLTPAVAQETDVNEPLKPELEVPVPLQPAPPGSSQAWAGQAVMPEFLSAQQIRDIQQALEARGAQSIRVDGEWGADIEAAVRDFQKSQNLISQNGQLDPMTLMALGLNPMNFSLSGATETTGQTMHDGAEQDGATEHHERQQEPESPLVPGRDEEDR